MPDTITPDENEAICAALAKGQKIEAIKIYREATGLGLKEAKDFIDALIPQLQQQDPEKYVKLTGPVGCGAKVLMLVCLGAAGVWGLGQVW